MQRDLDRHLAFAKKALTRFAVDGDEDYAYAAAQAFEEALRLAASRGRRTARWREGPAVELKKVVAENLKRVRKESSLSQGALAEAMAALGFAWNRQLVADCEFGKKRRVTPEEIVGLAALFGIPALTFLLPPGGTHVRLNDSVILPGVLLRELMLGRGGRIGTGGPAWAAAALVAGPPKRGVPRPAVALWIERKREGRK